MRDASPFTAETLRFLEELDANNNRPWFNDNKDRYEASVLDPALRFIDLMYEPLAEIAPHFTAIPKRTGGSLMRIYRDTRFARDKTPYKTNIGIQFRHEFGRDVHAPGYYLHIAADRSFVGAGLWRPPGVPLKRIRQRIVDKPAEWRRATDGALFRERYSLGGESLLRAPRGFPSDHPLIDELKRKDFIAVQDLRPEDVTLPGFPEEVRDSMQAAEPLMRFLCKATGAPF